MKLHLIAESLFVLVYSLFYGSNSVSHAVHHSPETLPKEWRSDGQVWMWLAARLAADASSSRFPGAEVQLSYGIIKFRLPSGIIVEIRENIHPRSGWIRWEATVERDGSERALTEESTLVKSLRKRGFVPIGERGKWEDEG